MGAMGWAPRGIISRVGFRRFNAEFDQLPFAEGAFDAAIYNASLHYSSDYARRLRKRGGVCGRAGGS